MLGTTLSQIAGQVSTILSDLGTFLGGLFSGQS